MIDRIIDSFTAHAERNAFFIKDHHYTYGEVGRKVTAIRNSFKARVAALDPKYIGVMVHDDLESYCSCIAILLSGCGYVPLNPLNPVARNLEIIEQAQVKIILSSEKDAARQLNAGPLVESINWVKSVA